MATSPATADSISTQKELVLSLSNVYVTVNNGVIRWEQRDPQNVRSGHKYVFVNNIGNFEEAKNIEMYYKSLHALCAALEQALQKCKETPGEKDNKENDGLIFSKVVDTYKGRNDYNFMVRLDVNRYNGCNVVCLRRFYDVHSANPPKPDEDVVDNPWKPCRGGFRFDENEDIYNLRRFFFTKLNGYPL